MKFSGMIDYIMLHILSYFFTWFGKKRGGVQKKGGQFFLSQEGVRALARAQIYIISQTIVRFFEVLVWKNC